MRKKEIFCVCALGLLLALPGCKSRIANINSPGETVVCFGDSITASEGSTGGNEYPAVLARKLEPIKVINAGENGNTTEDALRRIERDVLAHNPRLVIVEFSANDFLKGVPKDETFSNLDEIVRKLQDSGAMVVLLEVSAGRFGDEYLEGFRRIAAKRRALLLPNILKGIFSNASLKSDTIHPNDLGYRIIAERVYEAIMPLLR